MSALRPFSGESTLQGVAAVGINPGKQGFQQKIKDKKTIATVLIRNNGTCRFLGHESYIVKFNRSKKMQNIAKMMSRQSKRKFSNGAKAEKIEGSPSMRDKTYPQLAWID